MSLLDVAPIIEQMLSVSDNVSDLNFSCGQKPQVEISGTLYPSTPLGLGRLSAYQTEMIAMAILRDNAEAAVQLAKTRTADLSYALPGKCRFRVNIFQQRNSYSIVMRVIPTEIPSFEALNLPTQLQQIADIRNGVVLLTGPTGSGKSSTLAAIIDRDLIVEEVRAERATLRPAGAGAVHISFKLCFERGQEEQHGCLLVPLPDAFVLAAYLQMLSDPLVEERRDLDAPDDLTKDAILEIGNMIGGAVHAALKALHLGQWAARSAGCQGVRAHVRPAFPFREGATLLVGRARMRVGPFPRFEAILMLPPLADT